MSNLIEDMKEKKKKKKKESDFFEKSLPKNYIPKSLTEKDKKKKLKSIKEKKERSAWVKKIEKIWDKYKI